MRLHPGSYAWLSCEVRPGPFPDERLVRLRSRFGEWVGFVNEDYLQNPPESGSSRILAVVSEVTGNQISFLLPGEPIASRSFSDVPSEVQPVGSVQT